MDWVYPEWNRKAAAFVSYGSAMGARVVQQLRETAIELQMAPIRSSVHIPVLDLTGSDTKRNTDCARSQKAGATADHLLVRSDHS
jgi:NAD(P)H-dependent FMN reductase